MNGQQKCLHGGIGKFLMYYKTDDIYLHRKIFPDNLGTKGHDGEKGDAPLDPNSSRSKARQARLERAERRHQNEDE